MLDDIKKDAGERMGKSVAALKQELTKIYAVGWLVKQQLLDFEAHPAFKRNSQMMASLFMYKSLREFNLMRVLLGQRKRSKSDMQSFKDLTFSDLLELA